MEAVRRGASRSAVPETAASELAAQLLAPGVATAMFFASVAYDLERLGEELVKRFAGVELVGCTTAGEIAPDGYRERSVVGLSFSGDAFTTVVEHTDDLGSASLLEIGSKVRSLVRRLQVRAPESNARNTFALLFIDGLSTIEEPVINVVSRELGDIPLVGGSAGDNLRFHETVVFADGDFAPDRAALALVHTLLPFEIFRTQHVARSDAKMVITEADANRRVVWEINAEPASEEYARVLGIQGRDMQPALLATHPVVVRVGAEDYARSVREVHPDGSLTFYSAIDQGMVLSAASATDMVSDLDRLFTRIQGRIGVPQAVLGFECVFRRLELQQRRLEGTVARLMSANNVVGFSTYGEQFNAMHLNQTFTGVAFGAAPKRT